MKTETLHSQAKQFPRDPGVYLMKDPKGTIIYVGKAKNLRNRVRSYFTGHKDPKTAVLVSKVHHIDFLVTKSEYEALILENNLIKEYTPRYNINLKDGKTYPVIRITNDAYPRVFRTRRIIRDGSQYFGPYTNIKAIELYLEVIDRLYPLRKCRGPLKKRESPCLYYHIGKCPGPCAGLISKEDYRKRVAKVARLLSKPPKTLIKEFERDMKKASANLQFEDAAYYRDVIQAMEEVFAEQQVVDYDQETRDYIGWYNQDQYHSFVVLQMREGKLAGTDMFRSQGYGEDSENLLQFITQYYSQHDRRPAVVYLGEPDVLPAIQEFFSSELASAIRAEIPESDRDSSILEMARENARQDGLKRIHELGSLPALEELQRILQLPSLPLRIEGFDIAQLHGKHTIASLVSFHQGKPDKAQYRYYKIKTLDGGIDDFESMREAVARRYSRLLNEDRDMPDLILIDGGKGQLSAAKSILDSLGLGDLAILGLAKQEEEIFLPGRSKSITLPPGHPALRILQNVRDEAHRFATGLNQRLRSGDLHLETLESIPGIGPARAKKILQRYTSMKVIRDKTAQEISQDCGIPLAAATALEHQLGRISNPLEILDTDFSD
ncbi:excinuclease ABC subunit UvrC [Spirochaeta lutea]|uniref:excinuclease ABC subunit UvrC n=1 Tax=Spirochaeta lutea TaxID=1480694 RepID=UPI000A8381B6|nr:excinuclease ABC subunit UvrC [Spirochaeta lutea]